MLITLYCNFGKVSERMYLIIIQVSVESRFLLNCSFLLRMVSVLAAATQLYHFVNLKMYKAAKILKYKKGAYKNVQMHCDNYSKCYINSLSIFF